MIKLTNLADYAVLLMCHLAQEPQKLSSAVGLAGISQVPVPTVSKILGALSRAGVLRSQRGLKGGFYLARPADDISVADIVEAVDGPIALTNCIDDTPGDCTLESLCMMKPHWQTINLAVKDALTEVSLAEIATPQVSAQPMTELAVMAAALGKGQP